MRFDLLNTVASNPDIIANRDVDISLVRANSSITFHTSSWFSMLGPPVRIVYFFIGYIMHKILLFRKCK